MNVSADNSRSPYIVAVSAILVLAVFSLYTYQERMLFIDSAWITFNIINTESFVFAEHRYGAFITQMFPLIGTYMGLSLKTILLCYSLSFYLFYLGSALLLGFLFRQRWLAVLLALYLTLFVSDVYYWPNNEVHQGITWMFLFIGLYQYLQQRQKIIGYFFLVPLAILAISSHLLVFVPLAFLWVLIHSQTRLTILLRDKRFIGTTCLLVVLMIVKYKLSNSGWYDPVKLEGVKKVSVAGIIDAFTSGQSKTFAGLLLTNYWLAIAVFCGSCFMLIKAKQYLNSLSMLLFACGYYLLICLTFPDAYPRSLRFYMESEWSALSVIIAAPLVLGLIQSKKAGRLTLILIVVFSIRLGYIAHSYAYFHSRFKNLEWALRDIQDKKISKALIIEDKNKSEERFIMDWGLPVESMLLSKIRGDKVQTTFKVIDDHMPAMETSDSFYSCFNIQPVKTLNNQYFILDSTQQYRIIKHVATRKK